MAEAATDGDVRRMRSDGDEDGEGGGDEERQLMGLVRHSALKPATCLDYDIRRQLYCGDATHPGDGEVRRASQICTATPDVRKIARERERELSIVMLS